MIAYTGDEKFGEYTSAPLGWLLCDGSVIPTVYTALRAMVGNTTPDKRGRATVGTGLGFGLGTSGGNDTVQLGEAQMPTHDHPFTGSSHSHGFTGGSHSHGFSGSSHSHNVLANPHSHSVSGGQFVVTGGSGAGLSFDGSSGHGASITVATTVTGATSSVSTAGTVASASTGGTVASASTAGTVGNSGSGNAFSVQNPYVVALAIIKV